MGLTIRAMPRSSENRTAFGERLAALRKERGFTQVQLAEAIGSTQRAISYYENHADYPPPAVLAEIAKVLKVTTDELFGLKPAETRRKNEDPETKRLWKKFRQVLSLPEKDQRAIIRLVNSLVAANGRR